MTGPGPGKILLDNAKVYLITDKGRVKIDSEVYIHLKGYSYARVTHLDIEHPIMNSLIKPKTGGFLKILNYGDTIKISLEKPIELKYMDIKYKVYAVEVSHEHFSRLIKGGYTVTWVGGKDGGIYIGFRKGEIKKLEEIGRLYGYEV